MAKRKFKLSAKQKANRLARFIKKYGYNPNESYRPTRKIGRPKNTSIYSYNASSVKMANERLRKMEKVYKTAMDSYEYGQVMKYAVEYPTTKGRIYNVTKNGIRFLNKTQFNKLDKKGKEYYNRILSQFLEAKTTTKTGLDERFSKAYNTFMKNYGHLQPDLSIEDYKQLFRTYRDMVEVDKNSHFGYNELSQMLNEVDINAVMTDNQLEMAMKYVSGNRLMSLPQKYRFRT